MTVGEFINLLTAYDPETDVMIKRGHVISSDIKLEYAFGDEEWLIIK